MVSVFWRYGCRCVLCGAVARTAPSVVLCGVREWVRCLATAVLRLWRPFLCLARGCLMNGWRIGYLLPWLVAFYGGCGCLVWCGGRGCMVCGVVAWGRGYGVVMLL